MAKSTIAVIGNPQLKDQKLTEHLTKLAELTAKKIELEKAEAKCQQAVFESAIKDIKSLLSLSSVIGQPRGAADPPVVNVFPWVYVGDQATLSAQLQAVGDGSYVVNPEGSLTVLRENGDDDEISISGALTVLFERTPNGWAGTLTSADLFLAMDGFSAQLNLAGSFVFPFELAAEPENPDVFIGSCAVRVAVSAPFLGDPDWRLVLPIRATDPLSGFEIATGDEPVPATSIYPTLASVADPLADCNSNGLPDGMEITDGLTPDCNANGVPDSCDVAFGIAADCDGNGLLDICDLVMGNSCDTNANGLLEPQCEMVDCDGNGVNDCAEMPTGDTNSNGVLDLCEVDCNFNGIHDGFDVAYGTSLDLNDNGVPDECDPTTPDLSGDGAVNGSDLGLLLASWDTADPAADLNQDGIVNGADLGLLLSYWTFEDLGG